MSATRHNVYLIITLICLVILNPEKTPAQAINLLYQAGHNRRAVPRSNGGSH